ncbi:hypothetical protein ACH5RR_001299 [Cinchona calisaya]|uniref:Uncharacterized protein n=1 Tax=Cinchona calisaya TaxID=153742 RepID=A0ABD3B3T5_9GENT
MISFADSNVSFSMLHSLKKELDIKLENKRLRNKEIYFRIKATSFTAEKGTTTRYNVLACLSTEPQPMLTAMTNNIGQSSHTNEEQAEHNLIPTEKDTMLPSSEEIAKIVKCGHIPRSLASEKVGELERGVNADWAKDGFDRRTDLAGSVSKSTNRRRWCEWRRWAAFSPSMEKEVVA